MNYYDVHDYVSNSDLNALRNALNLTEAIPNLQEHYAFGNLVDAAALEKHRIDGNTLAVESGGNLVFEDHRIKTAEEMALAFHSQETLSFVFHNAKTQYCFFRNHFEVTHDGYTFTIRAKCKLDLYRRKLIGGDLKSTACTSQGAFVDSIFHFNYDQQAAWYMDLSRLDRFMIIGLGKHKKRGKHNVFTYAVNRGDETYQGGKAKYSRLAYKYHFFINNFHNSAQ